MRSVENAASGPHPTPIIPTDGGDIRLPATVDSSGPTPTASIIKGGGQKVWKKFRVRKDHRRLQGVIHGKRCGVTKTIGAAARKRWRNQSSAASEKQPSTSLSLRCVRTREGCSWLIRGRRSHSHYRSVAGKSWPQVCTGSDGLGFPRRGGLAVGFNLNSGPLKTLLGKGHTT